MNHAHKTNADDPDAHHYRFSFIAGDGWLASVSPVSANSWRFGHYLIERQCNGSPAFQRILILVASSFNKIEEMQHYEPAGIAFLTQPE
jgi:hypothetical protein